MEPVKPLSRESEVGVALGIILSILTCGLYMIYWNYLQMKALNQLLGREEYKFWPWLVLSIVTCGIYHVYYEYKMGSDLYVYLKEHGYEVTSNLAAIGLVFAALGLPIISDAIYQH